LLDDEIPDETLLLELVDCWPEEVERAEDSGEDAVVGESGGVKETFR